MSKDNLKLNGSEIVALIVMGILVLMFAFNSVKIAGISAGATIGSTSTSEVIPSGIPAVYGKALGISYDDVSASNPYGADATIGVLSNLDRSITLTGDDLQRYIDVLYNMNDGISCEFCCGARSVIFEDGQAACGCAHSYAMRGLAKYLISEHPTEFTDEEILSEVGKWKVLFFPGIHEGKASVLESEGIEVNYVNLASNKYRGIEKGQASGGMVGGC